MPSGEVAITPPPQFNRSFEMSSVRHDQSPHAEAPVQGVTPSTSKQVTLSASSPLARFTSLSVEEVMERVHRRCLAILGRHRDLDSWDVCQDVMVTILRRGFGKKFDPRTAAFMSYVDTLIRRACARAIRRSRIHSTSSMRGTSL